MRRKDILAEGEYYHLLGRGNSKQKIFFDKDDYMRFLFCVLYLQSPHYFPQLGRCVNQFVQHPMLDKLMDDVVDNRYVELVTFCLMPNHFHLLVKNIDEYGISKYMQRVLNSYTKYFNTKYERSGHLFQGPYKAVHVASDKQLQYLSAYIHRNPRELKTWKNKEHTYPWSSFQDYVTENRWGGLLVPGIVLDSYKDGAAYKQSVKESGAKAEKIVEDLTF